MDKFELRRYADVITEIEVLEEEIEQLHNMAYPSAKLNGMPGGGGQTSDRVAMIASKVADLTEILEVRKAAAMEMCRRIEDAIAELPPQDKTLMRLKYVLDYTWDEVAERTHYSIRQVYYQHGRILREIADK